ncbi:hypothetical protein R6Q59_022137 [Mikania micrantha]|uniref:Uncharacterized protein n=1 Tax=Mikania micrantha TaxID=192012 RepID=A0A5N6MWZ4_9ASTR|nr:hypothetical protein E3N88_27131 [Mikania micrantha]
MSPPPLTKPNPTSLTDFIFSPKSISNFIPKRRSFTFPIMPFTTTNNHHFATPQSLSDWLRPRLPSDSFAAWGTKPGTKNIHNLWLELAEGETSLADSTPPVRTVEVVVVRVRDTQNRILIESHQQLSNGDIRDRSRPLSEKMKPGETVEAAVFRAVKEELGSIIRVSRSLDKDEEFVKIIPDSYSRKVEERVSVSYPGLPACYILHTVDAFVDGLPDCEFLTEEEDEYQNLDGKGSHLAVSCKKHHWKWVDSNTLSS